MQVSTTVSWRSQNGSCLSERLTGVANFGGARWGKWVWEECKDVARLCARAIASEHGELCRRGEMLDDGGENREEEKQRPAWWYKARARQERSTTAAWSPPRKQLRAMDEKPREGMRRVAMSRHTAAGFNVHRLKPSPSPPFSWFQTETWRSTLIELVHLDIGFIFALRNKH